jgi:hypothetical protein
MVDLKEVIAQRDQARHDDDLFIATTVITIVIIIMVGSTPQQRHSTLITQLHLLL